MKRHPDNKSDTSGVKLTAREREAKAVEMRKAGFHLHVIASECGYASASGAHKAITRALRRLAEKLDNDTEELRALEQERLDRIWGEAYQQVTAKGVAVETKLKAIVACVQISRQRARICGLNKPEQVHVGNAGDKPFEVNQLPSTSHQAHGILGALLSGEEGGTLRLGQEDYSVEDILEALTGPVQGSA